MMRRLNWSITTSHRSQSILALRAFLMVEHLGIRRLADIEVGRSAPVLFRDFGIHGLPPRWSRRLGGPPARLLTSAEVSMSGKHYSKNELQVIAAMRDRGLSIR